MLFLWLKAFHIVAIICWFAALFYLPRLFVYHAETTDEISNERFKVMERKLYKQIANPAMMASIVLGFAILFTGYGVSGLWLPIKIVLVAAVLVYHVLCKKHMQAFAEDRNTKSHKYFRIFNEAPVLALIPIVILVVVKPF